MILSLLQSAINCHIKLVNGKVIFLWQLNSKVYYDILRQKFDDNASNQFIIGLCLAQVAVKTLCRRGFIIISQQLIIRQFEASWLLSELRNKMALE